MTRQLILILAASLIACNTATNTGNDIHLNETDPSPPREITEKADIDEALEINFLEIETDIPFSGIYVNEGYFNTLLETKSPRIAQESCYKCMITIPESTLERTIMIYNFHEGGGSLTVVKNDDHYQIWSLVNNKPESHLTDITLLTDTSIKVFNENFIKIGDIEDSSAGRKSPPVAEKLLFSGTYIDEDGNIAELGQGGEVKGIRNYSNYYPRLNYYDIGLDIDQVGFRDVTGEYDWFGFKFAGDTLLLYEIVCVDFNESMNLCERVDYGEVKHTLRKR